MKKILLDHIKCKLCGGCVAVCKPLALVVRTGKVHYSPKKCVACYNCEKICPQGAISIGADDEDKD
ncbi:4Fe-4S binding protein [candidate division WOR-3 bacterium]|nr:4Fe-4S binding protein [candidate division WOR-3 bacterium]